MSDTKMTAEKASNELIDYRNLLMEDPSDSVIDTGTLMAKAMELFLKMEQANGATTKDSGLHLQRVNNLAKLAEFVKQQKDLPPDINDIVNDNFWDLI